jgi:hypothetical protein
LELPPHLALCTTPGKIMKAWGSLPRDVWDAHRVSLADRAKAAAHEGRPALGIWQLDEMALIHRRWSWSEYVPPSFSSDQTMVQPEKLLPLTATQYNETMAISSSSIIDLAIPIHQADTPGIRDKVVGLAINISCFIDI